MIKKKLKIAVMYGGKSAEHEVSIRSAENIIKALDKKKYQVVPFKVGKDGKFDFNFISKNKIDVVFPIIHGPYGEDGSLQGFLKLAGVPFVGPSVLGSALGMDKEAMKRVLNEAGIKNAKFITLRNGEKIPSYKNVAKKLGKILFVKPANLGSSVGISKVRNEKEWERAVEDAFLYDTKIIVEEMVKAREIECAVLGNESPVASCLGELILVKADFYSYDAKYISEDSVRVEIPAKNISKSIEKKIQDIALDTFKALNCEGMGRVDVFLKEDGEVYVNEINTLPGFTSISMYPKLWEVSGVSREKLLDNLIILAINRFKKEQKLRSDK